MQYVCETPIDFAVLEGVMMEPQVDDSVDLDLMDELFIEGDWSEVPGCSNVSVPVDIPPENLFDPYNFPSLAEVGKWSSTFHGNLENESQNSLQRSDIPSNPSSGHKPEVDHSHETVYQTCNQLPEHGWNWEDMDTSCSVKERLNHVVRYIMEFHRGDVLVQIWVPIKRGDRQVLTTCGQPFRLDPNCQRLVNYRTVSTNYQFSAEENSGEALGMPGRVFVAKMPEWTPDVRFFRVHEYPRVNHAQRYDVRGSLALPVFERSSQTCLGVVEVVMTTERISYSSDLEHICNALQDVDLGSSEVLGVPNLQVKNDSYLSVLPEIQEVFRAACATHKLPLAQVWIPCSQQGRSSNRHSTVNYEACVSTVDIVCYVNDPCLLDFHKACSEHHLLKTQGLPGKAFTTNQPCFSSNITASNKTEYPLAHHARIFNLQGAVAIRLRSIYTANVDFVLEFFLPVDCIGIEEQKVMLNSLSTTIQQVCWSLRVVTAKELMEEMVLNNNNITSPDSNHVFEVVKKPNEEQMAGAELHHRYLVSEERISSVASDQQKNSPASFNFQTLADSTNGSDCWGATADEFKSSKSGKETEKRRTKNEKNISLEVIRQHFSGTLKDAAKSLGVCPTTLKRICRQHGITRWPSRKIKKVSHSLRKLQMVIDSVQGADGAFSLKSLYANFQDASTSDSGAKKSSADRKCPTLTQGEQTESLNAHKSRSGARASASNSQSNSCSHSSSSSHSSPSSAIHRLNGAELRERSMPLVEEGHGKMLEEAHNEVKLHPSPQEPLNPLPRKDNPTFPNEQPFSQNASLPEKGSDNLLRVKVIYGEEKVRLRLPLVWGLEDLKQGIADRFQHSTTSSMDLKYLDDDSEWVLLTCDDDLQECIDVYKSSNTRTIKISLHLGQPCKAS